MHIAKRIPLGMDRLIESLQNLRTERVPHLDFLRDAFTRPIGVDLRRGVVPVRVVHIGFDTSRWQTRPIFRVARLWLRMFAPRGSSAGASPSRLNLPFLPR